METQTVTVRLPKDLYEQLRLAAFEDRTSQAAIITEAVGVHLAERYPDGLPAGREVPDPGPSPLEELVAKATPEDHAAVARMMAHVEAQSARLPRR